MSAHTFTLKLIPIKLILGSILIFLFIGNAKVQAGPSTSNIPGTDTSLITIQENYDLANPDRARERRNTAWVPAAGSSAGSSGSNGQNRKLQVAPAPPMTMPVAMPYQSTQPYRQPAATATVNNGSSGTGANTAISQAMQEVQTSPYPITANDANYILAGAAERLCQDLQSPDNVMRTLQGLTPAVASFDNSLALAANNSFQNVLPAVGATGGSGSGSGSGGDGGDGGELDSFLGSLSGLPTPGLINVANEASGIPGSSLIPFKTIPQAVWMVQQMYKNFSIPLAVLLLLPGAVITQAKAQVTASFNLKGEDATSPFEGILRSIVAIFLIPATQLIVSYSIDVGNSLAYSVNPAVNAMPLLAWFTQVAYSTLPQNNTNAELPSQDGGVSPEQPSGGADGGGGGGLLGAVGGGLLGGGLAAGQSDDQSSPEQQSSLSTTLEMLFNALLFMFSTGLLIMTAFQLVLMCYLYLLGPIAAAFFAWPSVRGKLFRSVFGNWVNAVITVSLWRFYWMVILAIMTNRLLNFGEASSGMFNLQWEVAIYTCLIGLMLYLPTNPWNFDPGEAFRITKMYGEGLMSSIAQGKGSGKGGGGGGGDGGGGKEGGGDGAKSESGNGKDANSPTPMNSSPASANPINNPDGGTNTSPTRSHGSPDAGRYTLVDAQSGSRSNSPSTSAYTDSSYINAGTITSPSDSGSIPNASMSLAANSGLMPSGSMNLASNNSNPTMSGAYAETNNPAASNQDNGSASINGGSYRPDSPPPLSLASVDNSSIATGNQSGASLPPADNFSVPVSNSLDGSSPPASKGLEYKDIA